MPRAIVPGGGTLSVIPSVKLGFDSNALYLTVRAMSGKYSNGGRVIAPVRNATLRAIETTSARASPMLSTFINRPPAPNTSAVTPRGCPGSVAVSRAVAASHR